MRNPIAYAVLCILILALVGVGVFEAQRVNSLAYKVDAIQKSLTTVASTTQSQVAAIRSTVQRQQALQSPPAKTQDQLITAAVAQTAPSVVSIVVSKAVPQLQVTYVNPFGNDSAFGDIGIRIPVYQQKGTAVQKIGAGTGFLVSSDGYIVTNKHVVDDTQAEYTALLSNGSQKTAQVVYRDPTYDLAVVRIGGSYPTVASLGDSSSLTLGQSVIAIGNALGEYNNSVSTGIISGLGRTIQAADQVTGAVEQLTGVIQTDAPINPGNSGGPLVDLNGRVVGITVAAVAGSNSIGFAIPINTVKSIIQNIIR